MADWWETRFPRGRQTLTILDANNQPVSIAYGEKGTGQPIVFVHGVASWSYTWRYNIDPLAEQFRVICFDAKGSGFSDKPLRPEKPDHKVVELERVIRGLCDQPVVIVAESLGALVALGMVQAHPELVDRLVLINVPIFTRELPNWVMRLLAEVPIDIVRTVDQLRLAKLFAPVLHSVVYELREEVVANRNHITPEDVYWSTYPQVEFPDTLTKLAQEFQLSAHEMRLHAQGKPNLLRTVQENLPQITCPTLILWAEHDRWFPVSHGKQLHDRLSNSKFRVIPNCGHYAAAGQPEFVNSEILAFLRQSADLVTPAIGS